MIYYELVKKKPCKTVLVKFVKKIILLILQKKLYETGENN